MALVQLRELGSCDVLLPEVLFDMDFPGHYHSRIKSLTLPLPCIVGPCTSISCTLRLLGTEYRVSTTASSASDYLKTEEDDPRFRKPTTVPISSVAISSAQNDGGVFELNFKDDRYVPFEGAGAVSRWQLQLPTHFRSWDYGSLADIVFTMRYTSREGGERLTSTASGAVKTFIESVEAAGRNQGLFAVFDLRSEFATEWARAANPPTPDDAIQGRTMQLKNLQDRLPVFTRPKGQYQGSKVKAQDVWVLLSKDSWISGVSVKDESESETSLTSAEEMGGTVTWRYLGLSSKIGSWSLLFNGGSSSSVKKPQKGWMIVRYSLG
ncbi:hypothetical protein FB567DRAFT_578970 [Paraphoma chrysanthemicola]|uniref:Tc toxin complex TcA C-terminal TcB-binding domain-containing protein n=1 Tax=Paraphoma chrysanthemicola TaxID=798071 RepID=A0A8K0R8Q5_9PLEO|nr:hypothetical protein FB567DRAFT_578970 [Paraphoma chrysanthemicola]